MFRTFLTLNEVIGGEEEAGMEEGKKVQRGEVVSKTDKNGQNKKERGKTEEEVVLNCYCLDVMLSHDLPLHLTLLFDEESGTKLQCC